MLCSHIIYAILASFSLQWHLLLVALSFLFSIFFSCVHIPHGFHFKQIDFFCWLQKFIEIAWEKCGESKVRCKAESMLLLYSRWLQFGVLMDNLSHTKIWKSYVYRRGANIHWALKFENSSTQNVVINIVKHSNVIYPINSLVHYLLNIERHNKSPKIHFAGSLSLSSFQVCQTKCISQNKSQYYGKVENMIRNITLT